VPIQTPGQREREYNRVRAIRERTINPAPGRTDAERVYLKRAMQDVDRLFRFWLDKLGDNQPQLMPETCITSTDNDRATKALPAWQSQQKDADGYMIETHDYMRRASNRILVSTWYRNEDSDLYHVLQPIISPLPCDQWGVVPLNLSQWRAAVATLIEAHAKWKWQHAVRAYWQGDYTWKYGGPLGWQMIDCKPITPSRTEGHTTPCFDQAILTPVLAKHSKRRQNTEQDTPCRS